MILGVTAPVHGALSRAFGMPRGFSVGMNEDKKSFPRDLRLYWEGAGFIPMKCIILAAGEGTRMRPLTLTKPKPLLAVLGKPLLTHIIEGLPKPIDEVIIVIGYLGHVIRGHFGDSCAGKKIRYVVQDNQNGTFHALKAAEPLLDEKKFLMVYADDLFSPVSYRRCAETGEICLLLATAKNPERFGVVTLNPDRTVREIEEKPKAPKSNLVSCGPAVLTKEIFQYPPPQNPNGEYYIPDSVNLMIKAGHRVSTARSDWWLPIAYPEDLRKAEKFLRRKTKAR